MQKEKTAEIKVGITVIAGIIILIFVLGWAKHFSFNSERSKLLIQFENVAGLTVGDGVYLQGIKSGYVEKVYNKNNKVITEVTLDSKYDLREDAKFSIMMLDLMGGKKIEITPGNSENRIDYNKIQNGNFLGDISTTMAVLGSVQNDLVEVIFEVKEALNSFNEIMSNSNFTSELKQSVVNLNNLILKTDKILTENKDSFKQLVQNSNNFITNASKVVNENKDEIKLTLKSMNSLITTSDKLVAKLNGFIDEVQNSENNLGKLMYDKELIDNLSQAIIELKELSKTINEQINNKGLKVDADVF